MEICEDININYPACSDGKVKDKFDEKYDAKYYQEKTKAALNTKLDKNTKTIIPVIFDAIEVAASNGEWHCDINPNNKIFNLISQSKIGEFLNERGFITKYVTFCKDESVYRISWKQLWKSTILNTSNWNNYQKSWLTYRKIVGLKKHKKLGYVIQVKPEDVEIIKTTRRINVNVWPDNDSYNFWQEYDVEKIICEKTTYEEL